MSSVQKRKVAEKLDPKVSPIVPAEKRKIAPRPRKRVTLPTQPTQPTQSISELRQSRAKPSSLTPQAMDSPAKGFEYTNSLFDDDDANKIGDRDQVVSPGRPSFRGRHSSVQSPLARMRVEDDVPRAKKGESFENENSRPYTLRSPRTPQTPQTPHTPYDESVGYTTPHGQASPSGFAPVQPPTGNRAPYSPGYGGYESENGEDERPFHQPVQRTRTRTQAYDEEEAEGPFPKPVQRAHGRARVYDEEEYEGTPRKRFRYNNNSDFGGNNGFRDEDDEQGGNGKSSHSIYLFNSQQY